MEPVKVSDIFLNRTLQDEEVVLYFFFFKVQTLCEGRNNNRHGKEIAETRHAKNVSSSPPRPSTFGSGNFWEITDI